jgi:predicted MFS family arabinose efflux permease
VPLGALLGGVLYEAYGVIACVGVFVAVMLLVAVGATFSRSLRVP